MMTSTWNGDRLCFKNKNEARRALGLGNIWTWRVKNLEKKIVNVIVRSLKTAAQLHGCELKFEDTVSKIIDLENLGLISNWKI